MIGRFVLAAMLAGLCAGLVTGLLQHFMLDPIIAQAEVFEHAASVASGTHAHEAWRPADGLERTLYTIANTILVTCGYALLLAGLSLIAGPRITLRNAWVWGLCAFLALHLAPFVGLPPQLPGTPEGDLQQRQLWWAGSILISGAALWISVTQKRILVSLASCAVVFAIFYFVQAPPPFDNETTVPADLLERFQFTSLAINALRAMLIAYAAAYFIKRIASDIYES